MSNLTKKVKFVIMNLFLLKEERMKKVNKISLSLGTLGILMIAVAILLQYKSFQMEKETSIAYHKVTTKDVTSGTIEKVSQEQEEPNINHYQDPTEEVTLEEEMQEITAYEDIETTPVEPIVYDNLTLNQLAEKLNRSLKSTIAGKGYLIASYSLELGVDPYLATAIILHETGCNSGNCSQLVKNCNNVGGQKGGPSCGGGAYKAYATLDEGIIGYIDNLYKNYFSVGLTTPETMGSKYAASPTWSTKVNNYINMIKNK